MPLGFHVYKYGKPKLTTAILEKREWGKALGVDISCNQIFVVGPLNAKENLTNEDKLGLKKINNIVIHGAYIDNPWNLSNGTIHNIRKELQISHNIGGIGIIIHLGKSTNDTYDKVINAIIAPHINNDGVEETIDDFLCDQILFLEVNAMKSSKNSFETIEKINTLFDKINNLNTGKLTIGLCLDTAHLSSCGTVLDSYDYTKKWLEQLPNVPIMMHFNDTASIPGSGVDKHACLTKGYLWKNYGISGDLNIRESGLCAILDWSIEKNIMLILERDEELVEHDLKLIRDLGYYKL